MTEVNMNYAEIIFTQDSSTYMECFKCLPDNVVSADFPNSFKSIY